MQNRFSRLGISYLTFNLLDSDSSVFIDKDATNVNHLYDFIESAMGDYEGVLIHSVLGKSRAILVTAAYLMRKYEWDASFAIKFVCVRWVEIGMSFFQLMGIIMELVREI